jgi:hypothetical protein
VYVVVANVLTLTAAPLFAGMLPGVITPGPLAKTPVRVVLAPAVMVAGLAVKLLMIGGAGFTVTVAVRVMDAPLADVTARV